MTNEQLGQQLDRWQLIARDLIELLAQQAPEAITEFEQSIYAELKAMPEIHARQTITLHNQKANQ